MGKVLVEREEIERIKQGNDQGTGKEASCYLISNDDKLYKIYHLFDGRRKVYFDDLKHDQIAFPKDILIDKNTGLIAGYTMNYLLGQNFINGFKENLILKDLKTAYLETRMIILKLKDIYMDDNCLDNMLYDYQLNKINLIDTSRWYPKQDGQIENVNDFNWLMMYALLTNLDWKKYKLNHEKNLFDLHMTYLYFESIPSLFIEFLNELENVVSEYKGYKVKTIKDLII